MIPTPTRSTLFPYTTLFRSKVTHQITRGTRPLNITVTRDDGIFWGEYFDNSERAEVHIYGSRSEEHTSELQSQSNIVCRLLLEKQKMTNSTDLHHDIQ